jgi:paraquat-inducible protein A
VAERTQEGTWPRADNASELVACEYCDVLQSMKSLAEGESAHCQNCGELLYQNQPRSIQRSVSYSLASIVFMTLALTFPFLSMNSAGLRSSMTVANSVFRLWRDGDEVMALAVAGFIIILPSALILWLLYVTVPLLFNRLLPFSVGALKVIFFVQNWVMVEVFFLGTIVSLLKLVKLADVQLGIGFWSVGGLMITLAGAIGSIHRHEFWDRIEWLQERERGGGLR